MSIPYTGISLCCVWMFFSVCYCLGEPPPPSAKLYLCYYGLKFSNEYFVCCVRVCCFYFILFCYVLFSGTLSVIWYKMKVIHHAYQKWVKYFCCWDRAKTNVAPPFFTFYTISSTKQLSKLKVQARQINICLDRGCRWTHNLIDVQISS